MLHPIGSNVDTGNVDGLSVQVDDSEENEEDNGQKMAPKPYDDLFIEPADDYDVVYGDYNSTMEDGTSTSKRPYIRLNSFLSNITKNSGQEVRFKCEAAGNPLPLHFTWLKNHAPVEKNRKTRIKNREYWSRLIITDLDVLDSGYYQCVVKNSVASVNTTAVLRIKSSINQCSAIGSSCNATVSSFHHYNWGWVGSGWGLREELRPSTLVNNVQDSGAHPKSVHKLKGSKPKISNHFDSDPDEEDYFDEDLGVSSSMSGGLGRLPIEEDDEFNPWEVPSSAAGHGYIPVQSSRNDRWLDGLSLRLNECVLYRGDACSDFLNGRFIRIVSESREDMYDLDRNLRAAMMFINNSPDISSECKKYSHAVACYHMYKVCDKSLLSAHQSQHSEVNLSTQNQIISICRKDCYALQTEVCPKELALAAEHDLVGEEPKALFPKCDSLNENAQYCISIINAFQKQTSPSSPKVNVLDKPDAGILSITDDNHMVPHWCYVDSGKSYEGTVSITKSGKRCMNWSQSTSSAMNSAYYRKLNGISTPITAPQPNGCAAFELSSLLTSNNNNNNTGSTFIQHQAIPSASTYAQYSPRPSTEPPLEPYQIPEIQPNQLQIGELIGEGQFGVVHSGNWHGSLISGEPLQIAIKCLKTTNNKADRSNFEEEIRTIASFEHPNVIRLLGVCYFDSQQISAIFDYMIHGDLHEFLRLRAPKSVGYDQSVDEERIAADTEDFLRIAVQIASGMAYLADLSYVHRDLATRNCLVGDQRIIKICDFGGMKSCYEKDYYKTVHRSWIPVRWLSKEVIQQGRYTEASDVWAFGVTLWEIYSYGKQPYEGYSNSEVIELISMRSLLECPQNCPTNIYSMMIECWHEHAERRPTFSELHSRLQTWSLTSTITGHNNRANSTHSGSSAANRGSKQSSSGQSSSIIRQGGGAMNGGTTSAGTAQSLSTAGFSVPSPAPMQTMMTLNGVHPYHTNGNTTNAGQQIGGPSTNLGRSPPKTGRANRSDSSPLMHHRQIATNGTNGNNNYYTEDDDVGSEESD
ncbi:unnamed protein product [Anisakis simplex]|uniref:receptor protein-tyrosine kinase n=1 Tax=Anisakis simplex TaxID=6269 RepID=A0A158PN70_ANISI|nr:unnamed protein product [Anisakis simplex]